MVIVYTSENLPLALLETIVGLSCHTQLLRYVFFRAEVSERELESLSLEMLPPDWNLHPPGRDTTTTGDDWIDAQKPLALTVPSVVVPYSYNYLLNPTHPEFSEVTIKEPENLPVDLRRIE